VALVVKTWVLKITTPSHKQSLDRFLDHFAVEPATTARQRRETGRLRHRVYCEEFGYEPLVADGIEVDGHDGHSLHCLIRHRRSGLPAGCVRLICAAESRSLALEEHCANSLHVHYMDRLGVDRDRVCEFSRLAAAPEFRLHRHLPRCAYLDLPDCSEEERNCFALVTTATFLSAFARAELAGREHIFGMMEASLPRLLRRAGIRVTQAGDFMDYHGRRAAHFITLTEAVEGMHPDVHELYRRIRTHLALTLEPASFAVA
jgi:N-acyl amino acid synthase of PEP-CTERM/exosortase system